eukprot:56513-Eustigmatos_ZCMA.PRE.1
MVTEVEDVQEGDHGTKEEKYSHSVPDLQATTPPICPLTDPPTWPCIPPTDLTSPRPASLDHIQRRFAYIQNVMQYTSSLHLSSPCSFPH